MKVTQLSVFVENRTGALVAMGEALQEAGLNLSALVLADAEKFGVVRLILRDWPRAKEALERKGFVAGTTDVVATEVADRPGSLVEMLRVLEKAGVSIDYLYAFTVKRRENAVMVFRFGETDRAIAALREGGYNVLGPVELFAGEGG